MRYPYIVIICLLTLNSCIKNIEISKSTLPNVVIVFTDDQGYQDLSVFGSSTVSACPVLPVIT